MPKYKVVLSEIFMVSKSLTANSEIEALKKVEAELHKGSHIGVKLPPGFKVEGRGDPDGDDLSVAMVYRMDGKNRDGGAPHNDEPDIDFYRYIDGQLGWVLEGRN